MTTRRRLTFYGALGFAAIVAIDAAIDPHIVFTSTRVDVTVLQLTMLMPMVMAIAGPSIREGTPRLIRHALILAAMGGAGAATLLEVATVVWGVSSSPVLWSAGSYTFAIYDHLGETFDRSLYQICRLTPGILITRYIRDFDGDLSSAVTFVNADCIRMYEDTFVLTPILWRGC